MIEYPIPVRRLTPAMALTIICQRCHTEELIGVDDVLNDDCYRCPADAERGRVASTEARCGGTACMKYWEGDACHGCGQLGYFGGLNDPLKGCCSRRCMLQAEYAEALKAASRTHGPSPALGGMD